MKTSIQRILMLKGHSAGIGDLLRSTPAWRALKDHYGANAALHLALFTKDPGYVSEAFIAKQPLLQGLSVIPKTASGTKAFLTQLRQAIKVAQQFQPQLIIDFEPHGMRGALLTAALGRRLGVPTVGVAQFLGRGLFYTHAAPKGTFKVTGPGGMQELDYTNRDFAALAGLGLTRQGRAIEMALSPAAQSYGATLRQRLSLPINAVLIGVNIGCGTANAAYKRPTGEWVRALAHAAQQLTGGVILLTGAPNEREINEDFLQRHGASFQGKVLNLAGQTDLDQLGGLIAQCRLFISSDSGPYHMAVALRRPTLALFNLPNTQAFHHHPWVRYFVHSADSAEIPASVAAVAPLLRETQA